MKSPTKTLLIGTLVSGEQEEAECRQALERQAFTDWDRFEIRDRPNKEAHDTLYRRFMAGAGDYRYFLKLDADMVLQGDDALGRLVALIEEPKLDHVMVDVLDAPSRLHIPGIQIYSNRCRWNVNPDALLVDHGPRHPGQAQRHHGLDLVLHMPNPSLTQAVRYGVHRALKAVQPDRLHKDVGRGLLHWAILKGVWRHAQDKGDGRLLLSVLGAEAVFGTFGPEFGPRLLDDYTAVSDLVTMFQGGDLNEINRALKPHWDHEILADGRWLGLLHQTRWAERPTRADIDPDTFLEPAA